MAPIWNSIRRNDDVPRSVPALALALALAALAGSAEASPPAEVPIFSISKSENKNQVQYAVDVDEHCVPAGGTPVRAYWRMLELGPARTEALLEREVPAYGMASQSVEERRAEGGRVRLVLRALASRPIDVETGRAPNGACQAWATMPLAGSPAHLFSVFAKIGWPASVESLLLRGWSLDGTHVVSETIRR